VPSIPDIMASVIGRLRAVNPVTSGLDMGEIHHLAMVVEDLDGSMNRYSEALGLTWADPWTGEIPILIDGEKYAPVVAFTLSVEGPPHIELIQSTDRMAWRSEAGLHHFGVWVDEVETAIQGLTGTGFTVEVLSPTGDFAYLRSPDGGRIELVNAGARPDFARWLGGGQL
jgi:methylmalonyl-CoA/ethylmalonyl-CoA epimerase